MNIKETIIRLSNIVRIPIYVLCVLTLVLSQQLRQWGVFFYMGIAILFLCSFLAIALILEYLRDQKNNEKEK